MSVKLCLPRATALGASGRGARGLRVAPSPTQRTTRSARRAGSKSEGPHKGRLTQRTKAFDGDYFDWASPEPSETSASAASGELIHIFTQDLEVVTIGQNRKQLLGVEDFETGAPPSLGGPMPTVEEQGLCIGATFGIKAFNAVDPTRQISVLGFCRCVHTLGWHVNKAVLTKGGVVTMKNHKVSMESMGESLTMSIQVPYLFGVPQEWDAISEAINSGGGFIDSVSKKWLLH